MVCNDFTKTHLLDLWRVWILSVQRKTTRDGLIEDCILNGWKSDCWWLSPNSEKKTEGGEKKQNNFVAWTCLFSCGRNGKHGSKSIKRLKSAWKKETAQLSGPKGRDRLQTDRLSISVALWAGRLSRCKYVRRPAHEHRLPHHEAIFCPLLGSRSLSVELAYKTGAEEPMSNMDYKRAASHYASFDAWPALPLERQLGKKQNKTKLITKC